MIKKYLFYLFRWQLSTPILTIVLWLLRGHNDLLVTIIANLIGGLIFFWIDKIIFKVEYSYPLWEVKENIICSDCGIECRGYRLIKTKNYDKSNDDAPKFRCEKCSARKSEELKKEGILI